MSDKQTFAKKIIHSLQQSLYKNLLSAPQNKKFIQDIASKYFTDECTFDEVIENIKDIIEDKYERISIAVIMRSQKNRHLSKKNSQQKNQKQPQSRDSDQENYGKDSQKSEQSNYKIEIQKLKSNIISSFQLLKADFSKDKGDNYESFIDILDGIREIKNSSNIEAIHQKANKIENLAQRCFQIYKSVNKNLYKYENELKNLTEKKQNEFTVQIDSKSQISARSVRSDEDEQEKIQKPSKKEQLALKKQLKLDEKIQKETKEPRLSLKRMLIERIKRERSLKQQQPIQQESQNDMEIINKNQAQSRKHQTKNSYFELLPPLEYLQRHFPQNQLKTRYLIEMNQNANFLDRVFDKVYKLDHSNKEIDFSEFFNYDWRNVEFLDFSGCQLDSNSWNVFCQNVSLFPSLRFLRLASNEISEVNEEQFHQFLPHLRSLMFCRRTKPQTKNPLSLKSIQEIRNFMKSNGQIRYFIIYQ